MIMRFYVAAVKFSIKPPKVITFHHLRCHRIHLQDETTMSVGFTRESKIEMKFNALQLRG